MRLLIPLPFGEIEINVHKTRRVRPLFWYALLSAILHFFAMWLLGLLLFRALIPVQPKQQPMMVSISSAARVQPRPRPVPAQQPVPQPHAVAPQQHTAPQPPAPQPQQRDLSKHARIAPRQTQTLTHSQIASQMHAFEQTIAQAKLANDPVAGAATDTVVPQAPKRYALNVRSDFGRPQPEGILYPVKRWIDGPWVYYYVRYSAQYADGTTETGVVPWPIRFPKDADPFAHNIHRMPLPGPLPGYVLPAGTLLKPLVKNCYDHHYDFCPIAHE